jgi:DNA repair exonuclease SbcCD ATPase subunit
MVEALDLEALRQQLRSLQQDRDGLQRRLDLLTQSSTSNGPNTTSRAAELLWDAEKQLEALKTELAIVRAERDSLADDVAQIRAAKRTSDSGWRAEKQRLDELEKRLALYRSSMLQQAQGGSSRSSGGGTSSSVASPTASSTDRTTIELLLAKDSIVRLEGELAAARTTATAEQNMRMLAEQQLAAVRQQLVDLTRTGPQVINACSGSSQVRGWGCRVAGNCPQATFSIV